MLRRVRHERKIIIGTPAPFAVTPRPCLRKIGSAGTEMLGVEIPGLPFFWCLGTLWLH